MTHAEPWHWIVNHGIPGNRIYRNILLNSCLICISIEVLDQVNKSNLSHKR